MKKSDGEKILKRRVWGSSAIVVEQPSLEGIADQG